MHILINSNIKIFEKICLFFISKQNECIKISNNVKICIYFENIAKYANTHLFSIWSKYANICKMHIFRALVITITKTFDKRIRLGYKDRKVLLLLDNVSSHIIYGLQLNNVEVPLLPKILHPNCSL